MVNRTPAIPPKTQSDLEWPRLLAAVAAHASNEPAASRLLQLPFLSPESAVAHRQLVSEFMACIDDGDPPPRLHAEPMDELLARVRGEGAVSGEAMLALAGNLKSYTAISRYLENRRDVCPRNATLVVPEKDAPVSPIAMARLASEIESSFEPDGSLSDNASGALGALRRNVTSVRSRLLNQLEQLADKESDLLRDKTVTLRNNRYVLPVRADAHRKVEGIVHGSSSTGATIFVEPSALVTMGNDLMLAREDVLREEARILAQLASAIRDQLPEVTQAQEIVIDTEIRIAAARFSDAMGCSVPEEAPSGAMTLIGAKHPLLLLDGVDVVSSTIHVEKGRTVVISGPNAGGKTVILKTVGLLGLMSAAGLPIPADPASKVGIPRTVLSDIGDEQSLEKSLSTFSAHMTNIAAIVNEAEEGAIVLLDELAAGTDPTEGAALAIALLEELVRLGASTLTTSHFETLKNRAQEGRGFTNAAVGYDYEDMKPTFAFQEGIPGSSSALNVASRYGISRHVVKNAEKYLPKNLRGLRTAVEALENEKKKLSVERQTLGEERAVAQKAHKKHRDELQKLKAKQDRFLDKETENLWNEIKGARNKIHDLEQALKRRKADHKVLTDARKTVGSISGALEDGGHLSRLSADDLPGVRATADKLSPGTQVYVTTLKANGTVEEAPRGKKVLVRAGILKSQVAVDDLRILGAPPAQQAPKKSRKPHAALETQAASRSDLRTSDNTLDLRGMRADEALDATDAFLDRAVTLDMSVVYVLHGHGTGALKDAVRAYLADSRYAVEYRPGKRDEGGDGITVVTLG